MPEQLYTLLIVAALGLCVLGGLAYLTGRSGLDHIKSKTVGNGQHGAARWATPKEIAKTYKHIPFRPKKWREGENLPKIQGLILGSQGKKNKITALVDTDDIHCLMIGASGVGKTAFFLYPNIEYACASGMSFFVSDTKGDIARNYGTIAKECYGYQVSVVDLRNPTRSDGNNFLKCGGRNICPANFFVIFSKSVSKTAILSLPNMRGSAELSSCTLKNVAIRHLYPVTSNVS